MSYVMSRAIRAAAAGNRGRQAPRPAKRPGAPLSMGEAMHKPTRDAWFAANFPKSAPRAQAPPVAAAVTAPAPQPAPAVPDEVSEPEAPAVTGTPVKPDAAVAVRSGMTALAGPPPRPAGVQVLRFLDRLTEERPIAAATLERYLLLAQDVPGVTLRSVLEPSNDEPGAMTLIAQVSRRAFSGLISADNRAYHQTGPNEALTALDLNSFTEYGEKTEFSFYHTFPNSQNFGQVSSEFLVGSSGLKIKIYAGHGVVNPTGALGRTGYQGLTTVFGTQASYPVIRSRQQTLTVYGGLDGMEATVFTGTPSTRASFDSLRVIRLGEDYVLSDIWFGNDYSALNTVSVRASEGLRLLGASTTGTAFSSARQHERSDFTKVNFEVGRTQTLFAPWDGASVALMVLATGQWSDNILPPAEQFYLGGSRFTRGYYSGQVPGDKALAATAELQLNTSFGVPFVRTDTDIAAQFYVFYDWGQTWQNQSADYATKVASAGGGTRLQLTSYAELDVEASARLNVYPGGGQNQGVSALNSIGLYWRILGHF